MTYVRILYCVYMQYAGHENQQWEEISFCQSNKGAIFYLFSRKTAALNVLKRKPSSFAGVMGNTHTSSYAMCIVHCTYSPIANYSTMCNTVYVYFTFPIHITLDDVVSNAAITHLLDAQSTAKSSSYRKCTIYYNTLFHIKCAVCINRVIRYGRTACS